MEVKKVHRFLEYTCKYIYSVAFSAKHSILSDSECGEKLIYDKLKDVIPVFSAIFILK